MKAKVGRMSASCPLFVRLPRVTSTPVTGLWVPKVYVPNMGRKALQLMLAVTRAVVPCTLGFWAELSVPEVV